MFLCYIIKSSAYNTYFINPVIFAWSSNKSSKAFLHVNLFNFKINNEFSVCFHSGLNDNYVTLCSDVIEIMIQIVIADVQVFSKSSCICFIGSFYQSVCPLHCTVLFLSQLKRK